MLMLDARAPAPLDCDCLQPALSCTRKSRSIRMVADDNGNLCARNATLRNSVRQRQHIRAATGNENTNAIHKSGVWSLESEVRGQKHFVPAFDSRLQTPDSRL